MSKREVMQRAFDALATVHRGDFDDCQFDLEMCWEAMKMLEFELAKPEPEPAGYFMEWFQSKQGQPYDSMFMFAKDPWADATAQEREACAKVCEDYEPIGIEGPQTVAYEIALEIRARKEDV